MTKADSTPLLAELGRLIRQLTRLTGGAEEKAHMTATQRIALVELGEESPLRLNDLAQRMGVSAPTASRAVDALEGLGLVTRTPAPQDRRALAIDLTPAARVLLDERIARAVVAFRPATASLTADEHREVLALLGRMTQALREQQP